jgi:excisionase family DNA binding protein
MEEGYLTLSEAANYLGVSLLTLRRKIQKLNIPTLKTYLDERKTLLLQTDVENLKKLIKTPVGRNEKRKLVDKI